MSTASSENPKLKKLALLLIPHPHSRSLRKIPRGFITWMGMDACFPPEWYVGIILKTLTIVVGNDRHTWAIMARALVVLRKLHNGFKNLCPCFTGSSSKWSYSGWKRTTKISQGKKCKMLCKGRLLAPRQWNLFDVWGIDFWFKDRAAHPQQKLSRELPPRGGGGVREPPPRGEGSGKHTTQPQTSLQMNTHFTFLSLVFALWQFVYVRYELVGNSDFQVSDRQFYCFIIFSVVTLFFFLQLTEEILLADHITATCYSPQARKRGRKHRTEATQYNYSKRESWTSTENSLEMRRHGGYSANNSVHSSKEIINLADVRAPLEAKDKSRPPLLHLSTQSISSLSPQAREMAGGQPDYVWESRKVRHPKNNVTNSLWSHSTNSRYKLERGRFFRQSCELPEFAQIETCCKNNNEDPDQSREPVSLV